MIPFHSISFSSLDLPSLALGFHLFSLLPFALPFFDWPKLTCIAVNGIGLDWTAWRCIALHHIPVPWLDVTLSRCFETGAGHFAHCYRA
jgi:hypothetical protein